MAKSNRRDGTRGNGGPRVTVPNPLPSTGTAQLLSDAKDAISGTLLQEQRNAALKKWVKDAESSYDVTYAPGYAPAPTGTGAGTATG